LSDSSYGSRGAGFEVTTHGFQDSPTAWRRDVLKLAQEYWEADWEAMVDMRVNRRDGVRGFSLRVALLLLLVAEVSHVCLAQSLNEATAYLDNVENEVMRVAAKASENFVNTCGRFLTFWKRACGFCDLKRVPPC